MRGYYILGRLNLWWVWNGKFQWKFAHGKVTECCDDQIPGGLLEVSCGMQSKFYVQLHWNRHLMALLDALRFTGVSAMKPTISRVPDGAYRYASSWSMVYFPTTIRRTRMLLNYWKSMAGHDEIWIARLLEASITLQRTFDCLIKSQSLTWKKPKSAPALPSLKSKTTR